jgi:sugar transferase EpsL
MRSFYRHFGKRFCDLLFALLAAVVLSPVIALVAIVVRLGFGRGVIFSQQRAGFRGTPFLLYKFRTMTNQRDAEGQLLPDEQRLPALGKWLRKYSLDELPQLWNVLRGDISLVGPRPLLLKYVSRYTAEQARRHDVKPGITGWAQLNGRNAISWALKFDLDLWYVAHQSMWLDLSILLRTVWYVLRGSNTSATDHATMPEFTGSICPTAASAVDACDREIANSAAFRSDVEGASNDEKNGVRHVT